MPEPITATDYPVTVVLNIDALTRRYMASVKGWPVWPQAEVEPWEAEEIRRLTRDNERKVHAQLTRELSRLAGWIKVNLADTQDDDLVTETLSPLSDGSEYEDFLYRKAAGRLARANVPHGVI